VRGSLWKRLLVAGAVVAGFAAFNEVVGGRLLPQTVAMKAHLGIDLHARTWNMLREWATLWGVPYRRNDEVNEPVVFLLLLLAGAALTWRRRPLLALYVIGFPLVLSLFRDSAGSHKRYLLPTVPFAMILVALSVDRVARWAESRGARHALAVGAVLILALQAPYLGAMRTAYAWNVQNIEKMQVLLGRFANLATAPGDRIATNDIGAIGYFSGRYVVDLLGLVSPPRPLRENLRIHRPKLLLVFLTWFRDDAEPDSGSGNYRFWDADSTNRYELIAGVELERNTICANNRMTAYVRLGKNDPSPTRRWLYRY
jgi:hypothetical protein